MSTEQTHCTCLTLQTSNQDHSVQVLQLCSWIIAVYMPRGKKGGNPPKNGWTAQSHFKVIKYCKKKQKQQKPPPPKKPSKTKHGSLWGVLCCCAIKHPLRQMVSLVPFPVCYIWVFVQDLWHLNALLSGNFSSYMDHFVKTVHLNQTTASENNDKHNAKH